MEVQVMAAQFTWIQQLLIWLIPLVFGITVHEAAHGWVANKRGDSTARLMGRLTLNPIKHIDPIGTIVMPLALLLLSGGRFTFGYAKPVPVNDSNLKNPRWDSALVAVAGPGSNLVMAFIWAIIMRLGETLIWAHPWSGTILAAMGLVGVQINLILAVLNMIPIPPLDGSRVLTAFLSTPAAMSYNRVEPYGFIILLVLLVTGILGAVLLPIVSALRVVVLAIVGAG